MQVVCKDARQVCMCICVCVCYCLFKKTLAV